MRRSDAPNARSRVLGRNRARSPSDRLSARHGAYDVAMRSSTSQRVGFYGCNGRAIRVATIDGLKPDRRRHRVSCPGCGHAHDVSPAWPHDATGHAEVVLPA